MASTLRSLSFYRAATMLLAIFFVSTGVVFWVSARHLSRATAGFPNRRTLGSDPQGRAALWPAAGYYPEASNFSWRVIHPRPEIVAGREVAAGALAQRYRLAGTFVAQGENGVERRQAVLDDTRNKDQRLLQEGEIWGDIQVESIQNDRIVIRAGNRREEIRLSMIYAGGMQGASTPTNASGGLEAQTATGTAVRFGSQISSNRWVFQRDAVMDYYQQMMDDPERMAQVFDSLKPMYDDGQKITGYVLGIEGESDFFRDVGLQEGDIVRRVNSIPMSSRRRAEYFIKEFADRRMNVFVLEVERGGSVQKLIYQVR